MKISKSFFEQLISGKKYILVQINDNESYAYSDYQSMITDFPELFGMESAHDS